MENFKNLPRKRLLNIVVLIAVLLSMFGAPRPVSAATIVVSTFADEFDTTPNGSCSLREAIYTANMDIAFGGCPLTVGGEETIVLGKGTYELSIGTTNEVADATDEIGAMGDLDIYSSMQIVGAGEKDTIIRPVNGSKTRIIHIWAVNVNVAIQNLTLTNGYAYWNSTDNEPSYEELGGGVFNEYGRLTIWRSTITLNKAHHSGGGVYSNRESRNSLNIYDSTISENTAELGDGGGIVTESAMVVAKSLVWKNVARDGSGGGIYNNSAGGRLSSVTVAENEVRSANGRGSGVYADSSIEILNSTIVRNTSYARNRYGIEIYIGEGVLMNNIIAFNRSFSGGTYAPANCWFNTSVMGTYNFRDVEEKDGNGAAICTGKGQDFMFTSSNINLSETLDFNLGLTKNYTLLPNSVLIDGGQPQNLFKHLRTGYRYVCSGSDQRGGLLPNDGNGDGVYICDVGAVEYPHPEYGIYARNRLYLPSVTR